MTKQWWASNQDESPWGSQQAGQMAAEGCWGLPQTLNSALCLYQQEKKQWQHQATASDVPPALAAGEVLKKV